jgi:Sulfotransferase family
MGSADQEAVVRAREAGRPPGFESRLAWIMGSPRTGSTWLLRMLIHPAILAPRAPTGMRRVVGEGKRPLPSIVPVDESYVLNHIAPMRPPPPGGKSAPGELTLNATRHDHAGYLFADAYADVWRPALRDLVLKRMHAQAVRAEIEFELSDPLVVVKEPNGSHAAGLLMSLLPSSRLIFLLRDGRDVVDSLVASLEERGWRSKAAGGVSSDADRLAVVRRESRYWLERTAAVQAAYAVHDPGLRFQLRYEDLLRDTAGELGRLLEWLGRPRSDEELEGTVAEHAFEALPKRLTGPGKPRRAATPGLWRQNRSEGEQEIMEEVMGPKLRELGYQD